MNAEIDLGGPQSDKAYRRMDKEKKDYEHCPFGFEWVRGYSDFLGHWHNGYCRRTRTRYGVSGKLKIPGIGEIEGKLERQTDRTGEVANSEDDF